VWYLRGRHAPSRTIVAEEEHVPSEPVGKQEQTYGLLRDRILNGTYAPGHKLNIKTLAREFGVSPMPVREAIRRLEAEGWLTYRRHHGAEVAPVDPMSASDALTTLALLEGFATALSAPHLQPDDFKRLRELNEDIREALIALDALRVFDRNRAFHQGIYQHCPNGYVRLHVDSAWERWEWMNVLPRTVFGYIPARGVKSIEEHEELLQLIEKGHDARDIEFFVREHNLRTVAAYEEARAASAHDAA
jgi:DNA-binding GntR family transcriptional regulator